MYVCIHKRGLVAHAHPDTHTHTHTQQGQRDGGVAVGVYHRGRGLQLKIPPNCLHMLIVLVYVCAIDIPVVH